MHVHTLHIRTIKTWNGKKWAVVDEKGHVMPWKGGVTVFPFTKNGHTQALRARDGLEKKQTSTEETA